MIDYIKENNIVISSITLIYCIFIGILYSNPITFKSILINSGIVFLTVLLNVLTKSLYLVAVDYFINPKKLLKNRIRKLMKSVWLSLLILLPVSLLLLFSNPFLQFTTYTLVNVISFILRYICPFVLLFTYKNITESNWFTTIKVVSIAVVIMSLITQVFHMI